VIKDKPKFPPNFAQINSKTSAIELKDFVKSLKNLMANRNYILILISYGMLKKKQIICKELLLN
jgi:hypothetical protein